MKSYAHTCLLGHRHHGADEVSEGVPQLIGAVNPAVRERQPGRSRGVEFPRGHIASRVGYAGLVIRLDGDVRNVGIGDVVNAGGAAVPEVRLEHLDPLVAVRVPSTIGTQLCNSSTRKLYRRIPADSNLRRTSRRRSREAS